MYKTWKQTWLIVLTLAMLIVLLAPDADAGGRRLTAHVAEPFIINGELHPAGTIALKELLDYSPVASLHQIQIDGRAVGYVLAEESASVETSSSDELLFVRDGNGRLVLRAVALSGEPVRELRATSADHTFALLRASHSTAPRNGETLEIARAVVP